jgi:hypothetical protein
VAKTRPFQQVADTEECNSYCVMSERPRLVMTSWLRGEVIAYKCSLCGQIFLLPEDRSPTEAAAEVMDAFKEHLREHHGEKLCGEGGEP